MKKIILLIITIQALTCIKVYAQDHPKFYIKVYGGYSLGTPGSDVQPAFYGSNNENYVSPLGGGTFTGSKLGAGAGFNYGAGIVVPINQSWLAGIDVNNLSGLTRKYTQHDSAFSTSSYNATASQSVLSIIPNISYKIFTTPSYFLYTKLGAIVAIHTKGQFNNSNANPDGSTDYTGSDKLSYGVNLGMQAALGAQFKIGSGLSIFGEFTGNFLTVRAKKNISQIIGYDATTHNPNIVNNTTTTYLKSNDGHQETTFTSSTANGITTNNYVTTIGPILEHINNVMINVGIIYGFK